MPRGLQNRCEEFKIPLVGSIPTSPVLYPIADLRVNMDNKNLLLMTIPKIDEMLKDQRLIFLVQKASHQVVTDALREIVSQIRKEIINGKRTEPILKEDIITSLVEVMKEKQRRSLKRVVNATGVVLHTNLGRACLSERAVQAVLEISDCYSNLEYDTQKGGRGSRHSHVEGLLKKITGAQAAMVVNNNAAATILCLSALTRGKEVIVSRGELVEIGGAFRIPEIMEESGSILVETGTTNRTRLEDYRNKYIPDVTGAFLKVHTSNYKIMGFTESVSLHELCSVKKEFGIPVIYDMGSGFLTDPGNIGIDKLTAAEALSQGADVVMFSGDKLLGGPQGGIILGKKEYIEKMKIHPLARAFRVDKMTLAAMEATFFAYLDMNQALREIPTLRMITEREDILRKRADDLRQFLNTGCSNLRISVEACEDQTGGGSAPAEFLDGYAVVIEHPEFTSEQMYRFLRNATVPVLARIYHDRIWLSVRTIQERDFYDIRAALLRKRG